MKKLLAIVVLSLLITGDATASHMGELSQFFSKEHDGFGRKDAVKIIYGNKTGIKFSFLYSGRKKHRNMWISQTDRAADFWCNDRNRNSYRQTITNYGAHNIASARMTVEYVCEPRESNISKNLDEELISAKIINLCKITFPEPKNKRRKEWLIFKMNFSKCLCEKYEEYSTDYECNDTSKFWAYDPKFIKKIKQSVDEKNDLKEEEKKNLNSKLKNYSIFIEEDYSAVLIIYRYSNGWKYGAIISYDYEWLKKTFSKKWIDMPKRVSIQPIDLIKEEGEFNSYFNENHLLKYFSSNYKEINNKQIVNFLTDDGFKKIENFNNKDEPFSFAIETGPWFSFLFKPVKNLQDFKAIAKNNNLLFCKIMKYKVVKSELNLDLKSKNITRFLQRESVNCS